MLHNRSVPTDVVLPHVTYADLTVALAWLSSAFDFRECYRYGDGPDGILVRFGNAYIMLQLTGERYTTPTIARAATQSLTLFTDDVEAHCERARSHGAAIVEEPHETVYGEFQYATLDCDGHHWLFSRHARDLAPETWGAKSASH